MMHLPSSVALGFLPFVVPICLYVVWTDLSRMRIRNHAVIALLLTFVVLAPLMMDWSDYLQGLARMGVMLLVAFFFLARGVMGGGDAKFLIAAAPYVWPGDLPLMALILSASLLGGYVTHRIARATPLRTLAPDWRSWHREKFPMGLCFGGAMIFYVSLASAYAPAAAY